MSADIVIVAAARTAVGKFGGVLAKAPASDLGASGCRILVALLRELQPRNAKKGIAWLCIGGVMGVALTVAR